MPGNVIYITDLCLSRLQLLTLWPFLLTFTSFPGQCQGWTAVRAKRDFVGLSSIRNLERVVGNSPCNRRVLSSWGILYAHLPRPPKTSLIPLLCKHDREHGPSHFLLPTESPEIFLQIAFSGELDFIGYFLIFIQCFSPFCLTSINTHIFCCFMTSWYLLWS